LISKTREIGVRLQFSCGNIFGKQIGNVFVFTICFDVGLAVCVENDNKSADHLQTNCQKKKFLAEIY
jgi:hypothetical protein